MQDKKKFLLCRVCLDCDYEMTPDTGLSLFEQYNDSVISDKINALTNVDIKEGDGLPDRICTTCIVDLENAFNFKLRCEKTNETLLGVVNNVPTLLESFDTTLPIKEEYVDDTNDYTFYADDDITLADLQGVDTDVTPLVPTKPSRAIDLKLECNDCGGLFKSKCKLRVHWKKVHLTENLKCPNCLRKFKSFAALHAHKKRKLQSCSVAGKVRIEGEGKNRIFHCKECEYKSIHSSVIAAHIVRHSGERPFKCDLCEKTFSQLSSVHSHKESVHKLYMVEKTCQYCGKHFESRNKFYRHLRSHRPRSYPCKICSKILKTSNSLSNHMKRHSGVKTYTCEVCANSFYTTSELLTHRNRVHLKSKTTYVCEICNYTSFYHAMIKVHRSKHSATNIACDSCGMFYDNEQQLQLHKKRHNEKNYHCSQCDNKYYSRKNLCTHIRKKHRIVMINDNEAPKLKRVKRKFSTNTTLNIKTSS